MRAKLYLQTEKRDDLLFLPLVVRPFLRHNEREEEEEVGKHKRTSMIRG